tara:strand:+ start:78 stop:986 length:909 start_codon:yes stop_codon:yes gene_type:complete
MFRFLNKVRRVINKRFLRTPGVEYLLKNSDNIHTKSKHIKFWLKCSERNKNFRKFFFDKVSNSTENLSFDINQENFELSEVMLSTLSNNGLVILKNALPENERKKIIDYFNQLKNLKKSKNWIKGPISTNEFREASEIFGLTSIKNFEFLNKISQKFSKEIYGKIVEPTVELRYLNVNGNSEMNKTKGSTFIHTDRFLPHFKIFYTPFEIKEKDAPLQYLLSSHKINEDYVNFFINTKTFDETDENFKKFNFKKKIVCVPKNSLYVAFTNGFHSRSKFSDKSERSMLFLQYVERYNKIDYLF